jgi:glyoxylase-like metal-dependent hydrolase (beta-lactamase superfamily II)
VLITGFATGPGEVNCYLVATEAGSPAVVVDPGDEAIPTLEYYFAANGFTPAAVLLTHGHPTHAASAFDLSVGWGVPTYLHADDRSLLAELGTEQPETLIDVYDGDHLQIADIDVTVEHTPGHTPGSVLYRVDADSDEGSFPVVFTGDTAPAAVADKLLSLDGRAVVLPGHGPATTLGAYRRSHRPEQES